MHFRTGFGRLYAKVLQFSFRFLVCQVCKAKNVEQRLKIPGLPEKRADVIVGGSVLLEEIFIAMGIQKMKVSPYALREGVIVDTLSETFANYRPGFNIRSSSIDNLAKKFNTDRRKESAKHSARLAKVSAYHYLLDYMDVVKF